MVLGQKYSSRFSEDRTSIMVELNIWEEELFGMSMASEMRLMLIGTSPWPKVLPPLYTSVKVTVTTLGNGKKAHRRDKLRRSKSPAGINVPPSLKQAFVLDPRLVRDKPTPLINAGKWSV